MQTLAILSIFVLAASLQRVETQYPDRGKVVRVETTMNHLTVIELTEPVTLAAAGSPSFKIERRDNKVFIQPLEEGASTNLFVWTGSGRWNYELIPAASTQTMHFAIDQEIAPVTPTSHSQNSVIDEAVSQSFAEEMLLYAKPVRARGIKYASTQVQVRITDVLRMDERLFIRYVIDNGTTRPYASTPPELFLLESAQSRTSLHTLRYSQVGSDIELEIRGRSQTPVAVVDCEIPSEPVRPGETVTGIMTVQLPLSSSEPAVLRLVFPGDGRKPISLTVIL